MIIWGLCLHEISSDWHSIDCAVAIVCCQIALGLDIGLLSGLDMMSEATGRAFSIRGLFVMRVVFDVIVWVQVSVLTMMVPTRDDARQQNGDEETKVSKTANEGISA